MSLERIKWFIKDHRFELVVVAIGAGITIAIAGGDVSEGFARMRGR